jgi:nucleoid-associated protein YgaU
MEGKWMEQKTTDAGKKLPKNLRQIGEPGQDRKILIEDYAYTYLHRMAEENLTCMKTAILVGKLEDDGWIYIRGALETEMGQDPDEWFANEHWRRIFESIQEWFPGMELAGWFLSNPGFPTAMTEPVRRLHERNFPTGQQIFWQMDIMEKDETLYIRKNNGFVPLHGYYIYYEKNEPMQAYMSGQNGGARIESEGALTDRATVRFRSVMQEKKEQNTQRKTTGFLYASCMFLLMVVLVIGITMINNYDRMSDMENAIYRLSETLQDTREEDVDLEAAVEEENRQSLEETSDLTRADTEEPEITDGEAASEQDETDAEADMEEAQEDAAVEVFAPAEPVEEAASEPMKYQIRRGDTLNQICKEYYGNKDMVQTVCEWNGLDDGDKIYVGQTIELP